MLIVLWSNVINILWWSALRDDYFSCQHRNVQALSFSWTQVISHKSMSSMRLTSCRHWHMPKQRHSFQTYEDHTLLASSQTMAIFGNIPIRPIPWGYPETGTSTHNRPQIWPQMLQKTTGTKKLCRIWNFSGQGVVVNLTDVITILQLMQKPPEKHPAEDSGMW